MALEYHAMDTDFFGLVGELLTDDCGHRTGFTHIESKVLKRSAESSVLGSVHTLECLTAGCGHIWSFAQKAVPARG